MLLPTLVLAIPLGEWLHHRVDSRLFRPLVYVILLVAGIMLAVRSLL